MSEEEEKRHHHDNLIAKRAYRNGFLDALAKINYITYHMDEELADEAVSLMFQQTKGDGKMTDSDFDDLSIERLNVVSTQLKYVSESIYHLIDMLDISLKYDDTLDKTCLNQVANAIDSLDEASSYISFARNGLSVDEKNSGGE